MLARRTGWRNMYRWARAGEWADFRGWKGPDGLVWEYDAKYETLDSSVWGFPQTKGSFTRAGTAYYWDGDILKSVGANAPRFEQISGVRKALLLEPAATNKQVNSRAFTGTGWSKTAGATISLDQIGIDGVANTACTVSDTSTGVADYILFSCTCPNDSNPAVASIFVKKGTYVATTIPTFIGGFTVGTAVTVGPYQLNIATGATVIESGGAAGTIMVDNCGAWWKVSIIATNNTTGNTTFRMVLFPARGNSWGSGGQNAPIGSIVIDAAQLELNAKVPTSFIPTAGSEVSRTTEAGYPLWTLPTGIFTGTKVFTAVALVTLGGAEAGFVANHNILATSAAANSLMYVNNSGDFAIYDGTTEVSKDVNLVRGTKYKVAVKADAVPEINSGAVAASSAWTSTAWGTATAYDGDMAVGASLLLGQTLGFPMWVEKVWIFNRVLSDPEINLLR